MVVSCTPKVSAIWGAVWPSSARRVTRACSALSFGGRQNLASIRSVGRKHRLAGNVRRLGGAAHPCRVAAQSVACTPSVASPKPELAGHRDMGTTQGDDPARLRVCRELVRDRRDGCPSSNPAGANGCNHGPGGRGHDRPCGVAGTQEQNVVDLAFATVFHRTISCVWRTWHRARIHNPTG
jgi:hypothetical protein